MNLLTIKARVDELLVMTSQRPSTTLESTLHHGTLGVMQALYGRDSSQEQEFRAYTKWSFSKIRLLVSRYRDSDAHSNNWWPAQSPR
jgi:hypothetical protein